MRSERLVRSVVTKQLEGLDRAGFSVGSRLVVAVSGGADSSTLLDSLAQIRADCGLELFAAHFNHGLYGESDQITQKVEQIFKAYNIDYVLGKKDVLSLKREWKLSEEAAARRARYQFLSQQAAAFNADAVALGHTFDDQAETILMNFIRGTGIYGLAGMRLISRQKLIRNQPPINLYRPLLNVTKRQTEQYCRIRGIQPSFDKSNLSLRYTRNRLRYELIPILETYNPRIKESLVRLGKVCQEMVDHLDSDLSKLDLHGLVASKDQQKAVLDLALFRGLDRTLQIHLIRSVINLSKGNLNRIKYYHLATILELISQEGDKELPLPDGGVVHKEKNSAIVAFDQS